jgi:hypothetical protein
MTETLMRLSASESQALARQRRRRNYLLLAVLLVAVAGVLTLSAMHVSLEMQQKVASPAHLSGQ